MNIRTALWPALAALTLAACGEPATPAGNAAAPAEAASAPADPTPVAQPGDTRPGIEAPWIRLPPPPAAVAAGYFGIANPGGEDRLLAVETDAAARVEIHEMREDGGMMRMRELPDGLAIPARGRVELAPGGYHLMLMEPRAGLAAGQQVDAELVFENAGRVPIRFEVRSASGQAGQSGHGAHGAAGEGH